MYILQSLMRETHHCAYRRDDICPWLLNNSRWFASRKAYVEKTPREETVVARLVRFFTNPTTVNSLKAVLQCRE